MRSHRNVEFKRAPQVERVYDTNDLWGVASRMNYFKQMKDNIEARQTQGALIKYRNDLAESNRTESYRKELDRYQKNIGKLTLTRWNTNNRTTKSKKETFRRND